MDEEIYTKLQDQEQRLQRIETSVRKTETYFKWTLILTVVFFVLPLITLVILIPQALSYYEDIQSLGLQAL